VDLKFRFNTAINTVYDGLFQQHTRQAVLHAHYFRIYITGEHHAIRTAHAEIRHAGLWRHTIGRNPDAQFHAKIPGPQLVRTNFFFKDLL
jgi:hypothetical protein